MLYLNYDSFILFLILSCKGVQMVFNEKENFDELNEATHETENGSCETNETCEQEEIAAALEQQRKQDLNKCTQDMDDLKGTCQRLAADFENYKKRVERDRGSWTFTAQAEILRDLLPVVDDFDRAIAAYQKSENAVQYAAWISGFELIRKALEKFLSSHGVTPIEQMVVFDPQYHEAVAHIESPAHSSGQIVDVIQKGYMLNDRVLRVARVAVAK
jgi:molecular chaperone GrpE